MSKFSVIMPTYNHGSFIDKAIKSVIKQTESDFEIIIINNFSTDNTKEIIKSFNDKRIKLYNFKNNGVIAASRNFGIKKSSGKYIAFLDSDDYWDNNKLKECKNFLKKGFKFIHHPMNKIINNKTIQINCSSKIIETTHKNLLLKGNKISTSSVVLSKNLINEIGQFSEEKTLITAEDFDLWLRILYSGINAVMIPKVLGSNRQHSQNSSSDISRSISAGCCAIEKSVLKMDVNYYNKKIIEKKSKAFLFYGYSINELKREKEELRSN